MKTGKGTCILAAAALAVGACRGSSSTEAGSAAPACGASLDANPQGAAWTPAAEAGTPVHASFTVTIDPKSAALTSEWLQPHPEAVVVSGGGSGLRLWAGAKTVATPAGRLWLEAFVIDDAGGGLRNSATTITALTGSRAVAVLDPDPWSEPAAPGPVALGGIAPHGVSARLRLGFDVDASGDPVSFTLTVDGETTTRVATSSAPIVVTPDGSEAWAALPDGDLLAVIDTASDARVAQVAVGRHPDSVAVTPDGALVLTTSRDCNQLSIVDRASRTIVQVFGESDGIGRDPRDVVLSPDGTHAYVSAYVGDVVTALERAGDRFRVLGTVNVGRRPTGMSVTPDGGTLMVAHFMPRGELDANGGWVTLVATDTLAVAAEAELVDDGNTDSAACLAKIQGFSQYAPADLRTEGVPTQLAGVFLDPSGAVGWVPGLRSGPFPIFEGNVQSIGLPFLRLGANSPGALFPLDARDPRHTQVMRLPTVVDITDRDPAFLKCEPFMEEIEAVTGFPVQGEPGHIESPGTILPNEGTPLSETGVSRFVAFTRGGRRALVLSYVADELMILDAATHAPTSMHYLLLSGSNPVGLAVTPDGTKAYVVYENSTFASVLDLSAYAGPKLPDPSLVPYRLVTAQPGQGANVITSSFLERDVTGVPDLPAARETGQIPLVDADPIDPATRRGRVLFASSSPVKWPTLSGNREAACASCHPNGGNDGTVWGTMEGERRTISLWGGTAGRGWLHASATHADSTVFATTIVQQRLGGSGLSPDDVQALADYVAHGIPRLQAPPVDASLAATGESLFESRCTMCHQGATATSGAPDPSSALGGGAQDGPGLSDIGTATDWAGATLGTPFTNLFPPAAKKILVALRGDRALGDSDVVQQTLAFTPRPDRARGAFKAPSLVNVWDDPLFFHDGHAASLDEAVRDMASRIGPPPSDDEVRALVEYLKTL